MCFYQNTSFGDPIILWKVCLWEGVGGCMWSGVYLTDSSQLITRDCCVHACDISSLLQVYISYIKEFALKFQQNGVDVCDCMYVPLCIPTLHKICT